MVFSELPILTALGLAIGGLGGLAVPGRRTPVWISALIVGIGASFGGAALGSIVLDGGFQGSRLVIAAVISILFVGGWSLYLRERQLPR